jgi:molybdopterin converting factor small subunit
MPKLRLFANLREIAGTSHLDVPAETVGEAIDAVNEKFGPAFERGVKVSRVWVNGKEAELSDLVGDSDEVVILPLYPAEVNGHVARPIWDSCPWLWQWSSWWPISRTSPSGRPPWLP